MTVILLHHADAVPPDVDHMRPLSGLGRAQADFVVGHAREHGARPAAIWHSGKLRARQTAEVAWRTLNPFASFSAARGLQPDDDPDTMAVTLEAETEDVLLAGHMPHLARLLHRLTTGHRDGAAASFPQHGCVALEKDGEGWKECWRIDVQDV